MSEQHLKRNVFWLRDARNPIIAPLVDQPDSLESSCCMNPWAVRVGDRWHVYYGGGAGDGTRRIHMSSAPVSDPADITRHGAVLDIGGPDDFDARWTVLPHVVQFAPDRWHLYYTANCGRGEGLGQFPGIGLAVSSDGKTWTKHEGNPVLAPTHKWGDPDRLGMAGGSVIEAKLPDGSTEWRFYYTGCPTFGQDVFLNQQKVCCLAVSQDGIHWQRRGGVMYRDPDRDYENVAVAGPVVHQLDDGSYRMWYSAIGTRWGMYSICYAESDDGLTWRRGERYGENLQLGPTGQGWERQMVEYPSVRHDGDKLRLWYCGNGYGGTGIGTAVSSPLRAVGEPTACAARIVAGQTGDQWLLRIPEGLDCEQGVFKSHAHPNPTWHGPDAHGSIWSEWQTNDADFDIINDKNLVDWLGLTFIQGIHYRVIIEHVDDGLLLRFCATNLSDRTLNNVRANPCLSAQTDAWHDAALERTYATVEAGVAAVGRLDRGSGDPVRTHFECVDKPPKRYCGRPFWGDASKDRTTDGLICKTRHDGAYSIACGWQQVGGLFQNEDHHHCIHSVAWLGDIEPGETKNVLGRIVLVAGDAQAAVTRLRAALAQVR